MIIRALVKAATWLAFTPIPEYVHMIGRVASLGALVEACHTNVPTEPVEEDNPFYFEGSDVPEKIVKCEKFKDTAADVWWRLYPSSDFSIREAVKTFNGLDEDQKEIFVLSAIGAVCEAFYVFHSLWRFAVTLDERDRCREELNTERGKNLFALAHITDLADANQNIVKQYERDHLTIDWSADGVRDNYINCKYNAEYLYSLRDTLGGNVA